MKRTGLSPDEMRTQLRHIQVELARVDEQQEALKSLIRSLEVMLRYAHESVGESIQWVDLTEAEVSP